MDRSVSVERNPPDPLTRLVDTSRSLIKGGVTRDCRPRLVGAVFAAAGIGLGDFYKRVSPRGVVYLFRRRRRGRGGVRAGVVRAGGIRAISKGGRNTAIFIRAAGMQSRSGARAEG